MTRGIAAGVIATCLVSIAALAPARSSGAAPATAQNDATIAMGGRVLMLLRLPPPHFRASGDYGGSYGDGAGRTARRRVAKAIALRNGLALVDDWPMPLLGVDCYVMDVPVNRSAASAAADLSEQPGVAWSQPVNTFFGQAALRPDPLFSAQPSAVGWHLADLHRFADGRGVKVAIIDSMVERNHPDLAGQISIGINLVAGKRETPEAHGTAVAGIIAAIAGNGLGIAGIAPRAQLMALRACWQADTRTLCDSFSLAKALYFAVDEGANVINLSLGGPSDPLLARLLDVALDRGITIVAAYDRQRDDGGFPASHRGVIAVADAAPGMLRAGVFTAPGRNIPTTRPGGSWALVDGSSYAAAQVSGLIALMRSRQTPLALRPMLVSPQGAGGAIDSCASLRVTADCDCACSGKVVASTRP